MKIYRSMEPIFHNPRKLLKYILLLALVLRLAFILMLEPQGFYFSDTRHYDGAAVNLVSGDGFGEKYNRAPLYPVFMALVYSITGHSFTAVRIVEALLGVLLCVLVFHIAKRIFRESVAYIAAFFTAVFPHFILLTGILYSTHLFTILLASSLLSLLVAEEKKSPWLLLLSGGFAGLATLAIPSMFFVLPAWMLWILIRSGQTWTQKVLWVALFALATIAVLTPWTLRNYSKYGRLTLVRPVPHTAFPNLDDLQAQKERIDSGFQDTTDYLKEHPNGTDKDKVGSIVSNYIEHPGQSLRYMLSEMAHFWALYPDRLDTQSKAYQKRIHQQDDRMVKTSSTLWRLAQTMSIVIMAPIFLLALIGVFVGHPFRWHQLLLLLTIFSMAMGYSLIYAEVRYRIPVEPYILMFTSVGVWFLYHKLVLRSSPSPTTNASNGRSSVSPSTLKPAWQDDLQPLDHLE